MILVDTSIWIDHLRHRDNALSKLLLAGRVACHPFVLGELACGAIDNRGEILALLAALPSLPAVHHDEVLHLIEQRRLMNRGLGLVDVHLLAACLVTSTPLWTRDTRLADAARTVGVYDEA